MSKMLMTLFRSGEFFELCQGREMDNRIIPDRGGTKGLQEGDTEESLKQWFISHE